MKTNTERLQAALRQVDDGAYNYLDEFSLQVDGCFEREPLDGAINTHLVPLSSVSKVVAPDALFLRQAWAEGTTDDGREFEISQSGPMLILAVGKFGAEERETHTIHVTDLAPAWLRSIEAVKL